MPNRVTPDGAALDDAVLASVGVCDISWGPGGLALDVDGTAVLRDALLRVGRELLFASLNDAESMRQALMDFAGESADRGDAWEPSVAADRAEAAFQYVCALAGVDRPPVLRVALAGAAGLMLAERLADAVPESVHVLRREQRRSRLLVPIVGQLTIDEGVAV